jgi:hypothetical protein
MNCKYKIMCRTHSTYVTAVMKSYKDPLKPEQTTQFLFQLREGEVWVRIQDRIRSPFARFTSTSHKEFIILTLSKFSSTLKGRREIKEKRENRAKREKREQRRGEKEREARREREGEREKERR